MGNYNTPYDDSFRTLLTDCPRMIIPVINEMFGRNYGIGEKITLYQNEHYEVSGADGERITDSNISVGDDTQTRYDIECQSSPDSTMAVRIFEYATQVARENSTLEDGRWVFRFPKSGILYLRDPGKNDVLTIEVRTPGGTVSYTVPVIKMSDYELEDIFGKRLWFLPNDHDSDTKIYAYWTGTIANNTDEPADSVAYEASSGCPHSGSAGNPYQKGTADTNWDVSAYNTALAQAIAWAEQMEAISAEETGSAWRVHKKALQAIKPAALFEDVYISDTFMYSSL